jgi:hypothetical protein
MTDRKSDPYRKAEAPTPLVRTRWWQTPQGQVALYFVVTVVLLLPAIVWHAHEYSVGPLVVESLLVCAGATGYAIAERDDTRVPGAAASSGPSAPPVELPRPFANTQRIVEAARALQVAMDNAEAHESEYFVDCVYGARSDLRRAIEAHDKETK